MIPESEYVLEQLCSSKNCSRINHPEYVQEHMCSRTNSSRTNVQEQHCSSSCRRWNPVLGRFLNSWSCVSSCYITSSRDTYFHSVTPLCKFSKRPSTGFQRRQELIQRGLERGWKERARTHTGPPADVQDVDELIIGGLDNRADPVMLVVVACCFLLAWPECRKCPATRRMDPKS